MVSMNGHHFPVDYEQKLDLRLEKFVIEFVDQLEKTLKRYSQEVRGDSEKVSKWFKRAGQVAKGCESFLKIPGLAVITTVMNKLGSDHHRKQAETTQSKFGPVGKEMSKLREVFVETAVEIFRCFELQFMSVEAGAMTDLAKVATERIFVYFSKHGDVPEHELSLDMLTRAFLEGEEKSLFAHKVKRGEVEWKTSKMFEYADIVKVGETDCYFKRKMAGESSKKPSKYGYRLKLKHEEWNELVQQDQPPPLDSDYKGFLLDENTSAMKVKQLLEKVNKQDQLWLLQQLLFKYSIKAGEDKVSPCLWYVPPKLPETVLHRRSCLVELDAKLTQHRAVVLTGEGGMGKSWLALDFAQLFREKYDGNVVLLNAASQGTMSSSLRHLVKTKNLTTDCDYDYLPSLPLNIQNVLRYVRNKKCLFVFDDVKSENDLINFIINNLTGNEWDVLITSRNRVWEDRVHSVPLQGFSDPDAQDFLRKQLNITHMCQEEEIENLAKSLGNIPLALCMAAATIRTKGEVEEGLSFYLNNFEKFKLTLPDAPLLHCVIAFSLHCLEQEQCGKEAMRIAEMLVYLSPNNISGTLFSEFGESALELLEKYSIINCKNKVDGKLLLQSSFWSDKSIQECVKEIYVVGDKTYDVLRRTLSLLKQSTPEEHVMSVWSSVIEFQARDIASEFSQVRYTGERNTILHLLASNACFDCCDLMERFFQCLHPSQIENIINTGNLSGNIPLHFAAKYGFQNIVKLLLRHKSNGNAINKSKRTPLLESICGNRMHITKYLLEQGAVALQNNIACFAASYGNLSFLKYLIEEKKIDLFVFNDEGYLPLHIACNRGRLNIVQYLLNMQDIDVDIVDKDKNTPLHHAASDYKSKHRDATKHAVHMDIIKYLVENKKADVFLQNKKNRTPVHESIKRGDEEAVKYFIQQHPTHLKPSYSYSLLHQAAKRCQLPIAKFLCDSGHSIDHRDGYGNTVLHDAAYGGNLDIVKLILEQSGPDKKTIVKNARDNHGKTPLHKAAVRGRLAIVKHFVDELGVEVDIKDHNDDTPLHSAAYGGDIVVTKHLVNWGAEVNSTNKQGRTPVFSAVKAKQHEVMTFLIESGKCRTDIRDNGGKSLLDIALTLHSTDTTISSYLQNLSPTKEQTQDKMKLLIGLAAVFAILSIIYMLI